MSWQIACLENTLTFGVECAEEIEKLAAADVWPVTWDPVSEVESGVWSLRFDEDHQEHMDFLGGNDDVCEVLLRHRAAGTVAFGSLEGDNAGSFWGYKFSRGKMTNLSGRVVWTQVKENPL